MFPQLAARIKPGNPNHHLWNNNGTWFVHYVMYPTRFTKERVRHSLRTKSLIEARCLRDALLAQLAVAPGQLSSSS
jgi:hypothetical protein